MAKILCITSGLTGILNASFELVNRLSADGHELVYASPKSVGNRVLAQEINYKQLPEIMTEKLINIPDYQGIMRKLRRFFYKINNRKELQKHALETIRPSAFESLVETEKPDLLLLDVELHEYILSAHNYSMPTIILSQWFSLWRRDGLPYLLHDTIPGNGFRGSHLGMKLAWTKVRSERWWTFTKRRLLSAGTDRRSSLLRYAKEQNFPLDYLKENNWPGPITYASLPVVAMVAEEMEFDHDKRPNLTYVGPMVFAKRKEQITQDVERSIMQIVNLKHESGKKIIYCSVSTLHQGDLRFLRHVIKAVAHESEWLLIIGLGGLVEKGEFQNLPENVYAFEYIPQLKVLQHTDLSINHGGIHTINECIYYRVPMLVYSGKRSDQNGCAARVAYHKIGIMADKDRDSHMEINKNIKLIFSDSSYGYNIDKLHGQCKSYKSEKTLEHEISSILNRTTNIVHE